MLSCQNFRISSKVLVNQDNWAWRKSQKTFKNCICPIFLLLLQLGESSSAFLRGWNTFRNARSPNSRGCLSLNLNNRTPNEALKRGRQGWPPLEKKIEKEKKGRPRKEGRRSSVGGKVGLAETMGRCPQVPIQVPASQETWEAPWATARWFLSCQVKPSLPHLRKRLR